MLATANQMRCYDKGVEAAHQERAAATHLLEWVQRQLFRSHW